MHFYHCNFADGVFTSKNLHSAPLLQDNSYFEVSSREKLFQNSSFGVVPSQYSELRASDRPRSSVHPSSYKNRYL